MYKLLTAMVAAALLTGSAGAQDFPDNGRVLSMVVPSPAGGGNDNVARLLAPLMAEDLGIPVEVVNKPGAAQQIGLSEAARAKPDGYTMVWTVLPTAASIYLDPEREATFGRDSFQPLSMVYSAPFVISVLQSSPYADLAALIEAAKAKPGGVRAGTTGLMSTGHFANIEVQRATGVRFATVNFDGGGPELTALLGGHIDVSFNSVGEIMPQVRAGTVRALGIMSAVRSPFLPDVQTMGEQGIDSAPIGADVGLSVPAGTPREVTDRLALSVSKAIKDTGVVERMTDFGYTINYLDPDAYGAFWDQIDIDLLPLLGAAKAEQ